MAPCPREADVEEPAFLGERLVVVGRLPDRQRPLLQPGEQDRVPLEPLRPVEGEQVHAVRRALRLCRGPRLEVGEKGPGVELGCCLDPSARVEIRCRPGTDATGEPPPGLSPG